MAEIHIQRKSPIWPWIVGVILLAVVAWAVIGMVGDDDPVTDQATIQRPVEGTADDRAEGTTGRVPAAVQDYGAFAEEPGDLSPGLHHEYTAEGIRRLSAALGAHVEQNANDAETRERFDRFRQTADRLQRDPHSDKHAGMVRDVFTSAVDVFESARVEAGDVSRLRETATSISPDRQLLDQTDQVRQFFRQSAEALERASQRS